MAVKEFPAYAGGFWVMCTNCSWTSYDAYEKHECPRDPDRLEAEVAKLKLALARLQDVAARKAQLAKERAACAHNEHPEKARRPRCTATTRRGLPCVAPVGTQHARLCKQHAATMWDRYVKQGTSAASAAQPPPEAVAPSPAKEK